VFLDRCLLCEKQPDFITPADLTYDLIMEKNNVTEYGFVCNECGVRKRFSNVLLSD
jgi:hypothetical protein